jgi:hypothetical protein
MIGCWGKIFLEQEMFAIFQVESNEKVFIGHSIHMPKTGQEITVVYPPKPFQNKSMAQFLSHTLVTHNVVGFNNKGEPLTFHFTDILKRRFMAYKLK